MAELKCPHCGQAFTVDDSELASIIAQIRDKEFDKDVSGRLRELEEHMRQKHELMLDAKEKEVKLAEKEQYEKQLKALEDKLRTAEDKAKDFAGRLENAEDKKALAVMEAVKAVEDEKHDL
ncbi:MAG: hypothetical protein IJL90_00855, partial [Lachnospiraceae bacterium]|nr:hypothetical protein [Lachnospiraceae bacterium]